MAMEFQICTDGNVITSSVRPSTEEERNILSRDIFNMVQPHHKTGTMGFCPMSSYNSAQTTSRSFIVTAHAFEKLAGFVHVDIRTRRGKSHCTPPFFHVRQIARGRRFVGLGSHLMNVAIAYASELPGDVHLWYTEVVEVNIPSVTMFEKFRFVSNGTKNGIVMMQSCIK
jgi:hypothetical protein